MFYLTKKLPAMTAQKQGQTLRIGFSRRQNMENKPLIIIIFSDLIGLLDSCWDATKRKNIN